MAKKLAPTVSQIREHLRTSAFVHAEETGWRVGDNSAWLWVFCNDQHTLFEVSPVRSHWVVCGQLTEPFAGVLCCDGLNTYDPLAFEKQRCNAHILRRVSALKERLGADAEWFWELRSLEQLQTLLLSAAAWKAKWDSLSEAEYRHRTQEFSERLSGWLVENDPELCSWQHREFRRLVTHLKRHESEWLHFYFVRKWTQRTTWPSVRFVGSITRKVGGCNQSWSGSWKTSRLASIFASCAQQSRSAMALIGQVLHAREPTAIEIASLPAVS